MHLINATQQRSWHEATGFNSSLVKTIRDHTHIGPTDMHPDWDIQPSGILTVQIGIHGPEHPNPVNMDTAYIYSPTGMPIVTIPTTRLQ